MTGHPYPSLEELLDVLGLEAGDGWNLSSVAAVNGGRKL